MKMWFKRNKIYICIALVLISLILFSVIQSQTKININRVEDIKIIESINGIGDKTSQLLIDNKPYEDIKDVKKIMGIGKVRAELIERSFTTRDTMRFNYFIVSLFVCGIVNVVGTLSIVYLITNKYARSKRLKDVLIGASIK